MDNRKEGERQIDVKLKEKALGDNNGRVILLSELATSTVAQAQIFCDLTNVSSDKRANF